MILYDRPRKILSEFNIPSQPLSQAKKRKKIKKKKGKEKSDLIFEKKAK